MKGSKYPSKILYKDSTVNVHETRKEHMRQGRQDIIKAVAQGSRRKITMSINDGGDKLLPILSLAKFNFATYQPYDPLSTLSLFFFKRYT